jgi:hypothetical protein
MATLDELAIKYGSDKSSMGHCYMNFYQHYLPKEPKKILEIGVYKGASLAMWSEYFPDATIHGLDLFGENTKEDVSAFLSEQGCKNVELIQGNQMDWLLLEQLRKEDYDVIIDDGGHLSRAQLMTFFGLFNGKHYFIEDLHCCHSELYRDGLPDDACAYELLRALDNSPTRLNIILDTSPIVLIKSA